ncbi:MAG: hypothetical protein RIR10_1567, partial [Planctomycetota bacterium]
MLAMSAAQKDVRGNARDANGRNPTDQRGNRDWHQWKQHRCKERVGTHAECAER